MEGLRGQWQLVKKYTTGFDKQNWQTTDLVLMWFLQTGQDISNSGFLAILLFLLFPTFLQLSYFSYFLLKIAWFSYFFLLFLIKSYFFKTAWGISML